MKFSNKVLTISIIIALAIGFMIPSILNVHASSYTLKVDYLPYMSSGKIHRDIIKGSSHEDLKKVAPPLIMYELSCFDENNALVGKRNTIANVTWDFYSYDPNSTETTYQFTGKVSGEIGIRLPNGEEVKMEIDTSYLKPFVLEISVLNPEDEFKLNVFDVSTQSISKMYFSLPYVAGYESIVFDYSIDNGVTWVSLNEDPEEANVIRDLDEEDKLMNVKAGMLVMRMNYYPKMSPFLEYNNGEISSFLIRANIIGENFSGKSSEFTYPQGDNNHGSVGDGSGGNRGDVDSDEMDDINKSENEDSNNTANWMNPSNQQENKIVI